MQLAYGYKIGMVYRLIFTDIRYLHSANIYPISDILNLISDMAADTDIRYLEKQPIYLFTDMPSLL